MPVVITGNNTPTAGGVTYGDGTTYANTAAGSAGQALLSNGASAPTWGTPAASTATTATNIAGGSNGTIPYQSAAGTTQMLAVGTAGQLLQTNGAGAPSWVTASGSPMVYLSTLTASNSATLTYTGLDSTYSAYMVVIKNLKCSSASGPRLQLEMRTTDSSFSLVNVVGIGYNSQAASTPVYTTSISLQVLAASDNANTAGASGNLYIYSPSVASQVTTGLFQTSGTTYAGIGGTFFATGGFQRISSLATNGFRLSYDSGNITTGSVDIYGIKNS
jgi:hypothetical protein